MFFYSSARWFSWTSASHFVNDSKTALFKVPVYLKCYLPIKKKNNYVKNAQQKLNCGNFVRHVFIYVFFWSLDIQKWLHSVLLRRQKNNTCFVIKLHDMKYETSRYDNDMDSKIRDVRNKE